jgi:hypothetical protein
MAMLLLWSAAEWQAQARALGGAEGRQRRSGPTQLDRKPAQTLSRVCAGEAAGTVSCGRAASGRRCGNLGFRWDGESRDRRSSGRARAGEGSQDSSPPDSKERNGRAKPVKVIGNQEFRWRP